MSNDNAFEKQEKMLRVLNYYYTVIDLKTRIRTGWIYWGITAERLESIAEHTFGTLMISAAIYSEFKTDLNIERVMLMLIFHEIEEIKIGDITLHDGVTPEQLKVMGEKAVDEVFSILTETKMYRDYISEFEERKTNEAQFAFLCDKLDCDLQSKKYTDDGYANFENVNSKVLKNERVREIMSIEGKTVADVFIDYDRPKYIGTVFEDILNFVQGLDVNNIK